MHYEELLEKVYIKYNLKALFNKKERQKGCFRYTSQYPDI